MKNFTKIFMAVVAGMFAFSCTTDTTEDLGVKVEGQGGAYEVAISLEASRTQLGEKADGTYPLYWSEGDAIAINGVVSNPLTAGGASNAVFSFNQEVARPFCVVYPATEGAGEGTIYPVNFAATQPYTVGTFASGVAPMYGYAAELAEGDVESAVQLNHLTGVLRFAIKGEATLSSIAITAEKPIAGPFTVDCANGTLTASAEATNTVTVTFGEGLALGAEATPIYVAVPAGSHGLFNIVITSTEGESMTAKYNSESKPVNVGVVKEFGEILFVPTVAEAPEGESIIINEADMKNLSTWAAEGLLTEVTSVKVAGNIDMSKIANWAPIVNFPAITFDGGSAEGYEIKNLAAPLFEALDGATIQNVKLTGVNITETARLHFGSLVCDAANTTIDNCSAAGAVTYTCSTAIVGATNTAHGVGGMIGALTGASTLKNSTNGINVTITKYAASCDKKAYNPFGALVGYAQGTSAKNVTISNCTNLGYVLSKVKSISNVQPAVGGVVGFAHCVTLNNITNGKEGDTTCGNVTFEQAQSCVGAAAVIGACKNINIDTLTNYGTFSYKQSIAYPYVGGIIGTWWDNDGNVTSNLSNITNYGDILVSKTSNKAGDPYFGGIIGRHAGAAVKLTNCTNHGDITILADFALGAGNFYIGGIVGGVANVELNNCDNNGAITQNGVLNSAYTYVNSDKETVATATNLFAGGIAGNISTAGKITLCDNYGALNINTKVMQADIAGIVGAAKLSSFTQNNNHGDITVAGEIYKNTGICGMSSSFNCAADQCSNTGDITVSATQPADTTDYGAFYICGIAWTGNYAHKNFTNSGNITFTGQNYKNLFISGAAYVPTKALKNIHNSGTLKANVNGLTCVLQIGGICRVTGAAASFENCSNSGDIIFEGTSKNTVNLGGLAGAMDGAFTTVGTGFTNSGTIKVLGSTTKSASAGGILGVAAKTIGDITTLKNTGLVTNYDATLNKTGKGGNLYIGGCIGAATVAQSVAMVNTGKVYVRTIEGSSLGATAYVGGAVGYATALISNAKADCDVAAIGFTEASDKEGVGMVVGAHRGSSALVASCKVGGKYAITETNGEPDWLIITPKVYGTTDASEEFIPSDGYVPFWKKIYGGAWAAADAGNCDNCTYESANVPAEPTSL